MDEKTGYDLPVHHDEVVNKHGDRVLAIIGDERVTLTQEEVRQSL